MTPLKKAIENFLWRSGRSGFLADAARVPLICAWKFRADKGPLRAAALAFSTALGLVPLLALAFALIKGLGAEGRLVRGVVEHLAAGNMQAAERIVEYAGKIKVSTLGIAGFGSFMLSALLVLSNVEHCFNDIWGVARGRSLIRKITDYSAILIFCPLLILVSASMATTALVSRYVGAIEFVEKALPLLFSLGPFLAKAVAFAAAYLVIPNRRVGIWAAVAGGATAAIFWDFAESWYIQFGIAMARNNAVYGALAHLPAFLVWVYVGWCIVILGAELACVLELPGKGRYLKGGAELWAPRPSVALALLERIATRHAEGKPGNEAQLVAECGLHPVEGRKILGELAGAGLVAYTDEEPSNVLPARNPENTPFAEVVDRFTSFGAHTEPDNSSAVFRADLKRAYEGVTWAQWARQAASGAPEEKNR